MTAILRGPAAIDLAASASGTAHMFAETAVVTGAWPAGTYAVSIRASSGDDVHEVEAGQAEIGVDLVAIGDGHEARSHAQRTLANIEAVIEGRATKDQQSYTINGRSLMRTAISDLLILRDKYRAEVAADKSGGRGKKLLGRRVGVRFGR